MAKILLAYPIDISSAILADKLVNGDFPNEVTLFVDKSVKPDYMDSTVSDLLNIEPSIKVTDKSEDWTSYDYLVFGNLNAGPSISDKAYAQAIKNLFEKHLDMNLDRDVKIIFGQNFRGLIAMRELVKVRPDLEKNCVAVSSILYQGRKIAAREETLMETRGLPDLDNKIFFFREENRDKLAHMAGQWKWGQYQLTEAASLVEAISSLQTQGNLSSIEFAGVFPQEADFRIHPDLENFTSPIYLDRDLEDDDREKSKKYLIYLKKIDAYFRGEYTTVE